MFQLLYLFWNFLRFAVANYFSIFTSNSPWKKWFLLTFAVVNSIWSEMLQPSELAIKVESFKHFCHSHLAVIDIRYFCAANTNAWIQELESKICRKVQIKHKQLKSQGIQGLIQLESKKNAHQWHIYAAYSLAFASSSQLWQLRSSSTCIVAVSDFRRHSWCIRSI